MKPEDMPLLRYGSKGADVIVLQKMLQSVGNFDGALGGNFLNKTETAVRQFQMTHVDRRGQFLVVDG